MRPIGWQGEMVWAKRAGGLFGYEQTRPGNGHGAARLESSYSDRTGFFEDEDEHEDEDD